ERVGVAPPALASFSAYPALPRWANLCRASSAGVTLCCHLRILHENGQSKIRTRASRANGAPRQVASLRFIVCALASEAILLKQRRIRVLRHSRKRVFGRFDRLLPRPL